MPDTTEAAAEDTKPVVTSSSIFNDALANLKIDKPADEAAPEPVATSVVEKPTEEDTSFIPEELRTKPAVVETDGRKKGFTATIKDENAKLKADIEALRLEHETLKKAPQQSEQTAAELKAEREARLAAEERAERADFTQSSRFKAFEQREDDQLAGAKSALDGAKTGDGVDIDPSVIDQAARLTGHKRIAALKDAGADAETIAAITPYLAQLDTIGREKKAALDNWREHAEAHKAQERQQQEQTAAQRKAAEDRLFEESRNAAAEKLEPLRRVAGQEAWNKQVDAIEARAKQIFNGGIPTSEMPMVARQAAAAEVLQQMNGALRAKVVTLTAQLSKLTAAQPGLGDARSGTQTSNVSLKPGAIFEAALEQQRGGQ